MGNVNSLEKIKDVDVMKDLIVSEMGEEMWKEARQWTLLPSWSTWKRKEDNYHQWYFLTVRILTRLYETLQREIPEDTITIGHIRKKMHGFANWYDSLRVIPMHLMDPMPDPWASSDIEKGESSVQKLYRLLHREILDKSFSQAKF